ncbi:MAG: hypothetical protein Kow0020_07610 [Wenzhouxiangellaceae bacterium]
MQKFILAVVLIALITLTGCGGGETPSAEPESPAASNLQAKKPAPRTATPAAAPRASETKPLLSAPRLKGEQSEPGNGLELVIWAGDRAQYEESLREIAAQTNDEQYQQLDAALRWMLINDRRVMNKEERLFELINGKTGMEVLQMVAEELNSRG